MLVCSTLFHYVLRLYFIFAVQIKYNCSTLAVYIAVQYVLQFRKGNLRNLNR